MAYTYGNAKTDLQGVMHGSTAHLRDLPKLSWRAARNMLSKLDPLETMRRSSLTLYNNVYDYSIPADYKKSVDVAKQTNRGVADNFSRSLNETFDLKKALDVGDATLANVSESGTKYIRISKSISPGQTTLHNMDGIATNGTWAVGDDATNLTADTSEKVQGSASLNFDLDGSTTSGYIEISDFTDVDLTAHDEKSAIFAWVYIPDPSIITNFILRWGNDSSAYWSQTVTTPHFGSSFITGWNLVRFDWNGATETGTVAPATIDYMRFTVTYDGTAETDIRVDDITSRLGKNYEHWYYSNRLFRGTDGTWKAEPTADADIVNLDEDGYNIFLNELGYLAAQEARGADSSFDMQFFRDELYGSGDKPGLYQSYLEGKPSEEIPAQETYYDIT